jgi:hypothetical protein
LIDLLVLDPAIGGPSAPVTLAVEQLAHYSSACPASAGNEVTKPAARWHSVAA